MSDLCNGCNQNERQTPLATANPPGQEALQYRLGTHPVFLQTMKNRLANLSLLNDDGARFYPLRQLTTRDSSDPAIALLDAWATVCDVLTFYQERIANEGYLPTAIERRSILELAKLVGYRLKPGVAATAYLAFLLEDSFTEESLIPVGTAAQSIPGPGETPQTFETAVPLKARTVWNQLRPLATCIPIIQRDAIPNTLYLAGTSTGIRRYDPLLFQFDNGEALSHLVADVLPEPALERTKVSLKLPNPSKTKELKQSEWLTANLLTSLIKPQALQPRNSQRLNRNAADLFKPQSDLRQKLLQSFYPRLQGSIYTALQNAPAFQQPPAQGGLQAVRPLLETAAPFGANAPLNPIPDGEGGIKRYDEWELFETLTVRIGNLNGSSSSQDGFRFMFDAVQLLREALQGKYEFQIDINRLISVGVGNEDPPEIVNVPFFDSVGRVIFNQTLNVGTQRFEISCQTVPFIRFGVLLNVKNPDYDILEILLGDQVLGTGSFENRLLLEAEASVAEYTSYTLVKNKNHSFKLNFRSAEDDLVPVKTVELGPYYLEHNHFYSLLLIGDESNTNALLIEHLFAAPTDANSRIRFINAAPKLTSITIAVGDNSIDDLRFGAISDYLTIDRGALFELDIQITGSTEFVAKLGQEFPGTFLTFAIVADGNTYKLVQFHDALPGDELINLDTYRFLEGKPAAIFTVNFVEIDRSWQFSGAVELPSGSSALPTVNVTSQLTSRGTTYCQISKIPQDGEVIIEKCNNQHKSFVDYEGNVQFDDTSLVVIDSGPAPLPSLREAILGLDGQYSNVQLGDWVVIERPNTLIPIAAEITAVHNRVYTQFNLTAKATELTLSKDWLLPTDKSLKDLRAVTVQIFSGSADLAPHPISKDVMGDAIVLDGLYDGLEAGRWIVVTGERTDVAETKGIIGKELMMISGVEIVGQGKDNPIDFNCKQGTPRTKLLLADGGLAYKYKRDTVLIYGNVVKATHGETRRDVLGSGNASQPFQTFALKQKPLTYVAAVNPTGVDSSLEVRVNDVKWPEVDSLVWLNERDRGYVTETDNDDVTNIIFGDGQQGARLPTGQENITAVYRYGIGQPGNVKAEQIKLLSKRPLGVSGVINPLRASGGANREKRDQARQNVPLGVMALDRLVSVQDYADFARTFAGIDKASARRVSDGLVTQILVTIAGADDIPIDETSDLFQALYQSLLELGEPQQPILLKHRQRMIVILSAEIKLEPNYLWEAVEPVLRQTLLERFGFMRRQLSQPLYRSEITAVLQQHPGVSYVDVNIFDSVDELNLQTEADQLSQLLAREVELKPFITIPSADSTSLNPAYIAYLNDDIEETIILNHRP